MGVLLENGKMDGEYNLDSKNWIEKRFFGEFNAPVEYFFNPSFRRPEGFRIYRDSLEQSYLLELKWVANYDEVSKQLSEEFPTIGYSTREVSEGFEEMMTQHNRAMMTKQAEEQKKRYRIETKAIPVSDRFAQALHAKTVTAIETFQVKGKPHMINDGETVTFRCVVEDEVWTLTIHVPTGDIEKLSDLFRQMMGDVEAGRFDEARYLRLLEEGN